MSGPPPDLPLMKSSGPRSGNGSQSGIRCHDACEERRPLQSGRGCPGRGYPMGYMKKSKFRTSGTQSTARRKMAEPDKIKMEQQRELSAERKKETAASGGMAFEEPPAPNNNPRSPGNNHQRGCRTLNEQEDASSALFEGFSFVTKTLFSPESARKVAALWIENSEKAADQALN